MHWQAESNGWVAHPTIGTWADNGNPIIMSWDAVPLVADRSLNFLRRLVHHCRPWSIGVHGYFAEMQVTERCWCGGVREGRTVGMVHAWRGPESSEPLRYEYDGGWRDRFSRYWGTAVFYRPTLRGVEESL